MKKSIHCKNCNYKFEYNVNNMDDLKNVTCPKCRQKITIKSKDDNNHNNHNNENSNFEDKLGNFLAGFTMFSRWFYLLAAIVGIVLYCFKIYSVSFILSIICLVFYLLERIFHISFFRILIYLIILLFIYLKARYDLPYIRCLSLATSISFLIESVLRFIRMIIFSKIIKWASKY